MQRSRVLLPVVAGLVGLAGGVTTALVVPNTDERPQQPSSFNDPLRVGAPLVDLTCTGEAVLVLGFGDTAAPIASAVANNPDLGVRYLRTDESCETVWSSEPEAPEYVAYAGPYEGMIEPCELRMDGEHQRDDVTNLSAGNELYVQCLCVLPDSAGPRLEVGMLSDATSTNWVRALQLAFVTVDADRAERGPKGAYLELSDINGIYDDTTAARVRIFQPSRDITTLGVVEADTWKAVADAACGFYEF
ncbi:MAG: hypothetical protein WKF79_16640 [Nocardioides sp.]